MAKRIQIIDNNIVVTDTETSVVDFDEFAKETSYSTKELDNGNVLLSYPIVANKNSSIKFSVALSDAVNENDTSFTESSFRDFCRPNLGKSSGGGSGEGTVQSVNNIQPDENGDVQLVAGDIDGINSGVISFRTLVDLQAYPTPGINGSYKVTNDGVNNGEYSWVSGTTYTKNEIVEDIVEITDAISFDNIGYYTLAGEYVTNSNFSTTNFIAVSTIGNYFESGSSMNTFTGYRVVFFDENYDWVGGLEANQSNIDQDEIVLTDGVKFLAFTLLNPNIPNYHIFSNNYTSIVKSSEDPRSDSSKMFMSKYFDMVTSGELNIYLDSLSLEQDLLLDTLGSDNAIKRVNRSLRIDLGYTRSDLDLCFTNPKNNVKTDCLVRTISANVGNSVDERNILLIGDSLTNNQDFVGEVYDLLNADGDFVFNQVGTLGTTYKHEGRNSWRWIDYTTDSIYAGSTNAFWIDGGLNFSRYITDNGFSGLDVVIINLGTNDVTQGARILENKNLIQYIAQAKTFIDAIFADFPNCKVSLGLQAIGAPQFPSSDGTSEIFRGAIGKLNQAYVSEFDNGAYHANLTTHNRHSTIDRVESYPFDEEAIDKRNTDLWRRYTNAVHPKEIGYQQFADADYSKIRAFLSGVL